MHLLPRSRRGTWLLAGAVGCADGGQSVISGRTSTIALIRRKFGIAGAFAERI
jgi:hypothetical protein